MTAAAPPYRLEITPSKEIDAVIADEFHAPGFHATDWFFAASQPPELASQRDIQAELVIVGHKVEHSIPHHALMIARIPVHGTQTMKVEAKYHALLQTVHLAPVEPGSKHPVVRPLTVGEKKEWLQNTPWLDHEDKSFQEWLTLHKLRRAAHEPDLEFARRLFVFMANHFKYHYDTTTDRKPATVVRHGQSDCGGLAATFVSALRANGVPARTLAGRWAATPRVGAKLGDQQFEGTHVKTDFFAEGIGWVPVDPTGAVSQGAKVDDAFFGRQNADFITLALPLEHDFALPGIGKVNLHNLIGIDCWATGKGTFRYKGTEDWKVEPKLLK